MEVGGEEDGRAAPLGITTVVTAAAAAPWISASLGEELWGWAEARTRALVVEVCTIHHGVPDWITRLDRLCTLCKSFLCSVNSNSFAMLS